eukprot:CAMPEP_0179417674 /NCGR_PEP_ID=MMETSP0799-20121207/7502_1 /TAXON_ID=46947 /ORGANISM="Geminigera cryophila, Strain CCMP2564" /LENGTH=251 /DNA_ID=CAMNT_0021190717 /DNA_START=266 /DNA_END=1016 /DNA_ORIENTATION=+
MQSNDFDLLSGRLCRRAPNACDTPGAAPPACAKPLCNEASVEGNAATAPPLSPVPYPLQLLSMVSCEDERDIRSKMASDKGARTGPLYAGVSVGMYSLTSGRVSRETPLGSPVTLSPWCVVDSVVRSVGSLLVLESPANPPSWGEVEGGGRKDAAPKPAIAEFERLSGSKAKPQPSPVRGPLSCPALSFDGLGEAARLVGLLGLLLSPPFLFNSFASDNVQGSGGARQTPLEDQREYEKQEPDACREWCPP